MRAQPRRALAGLLLALAAGASAGAQEYGRGPDATRAEIFSRMLTAAKTGAYDEIVARLEELGPLLGHIESRSRVDLRARFRELAARREKDLVLRGVQELILSDIGISLDEASKSDASVSTRKSLVRSAYTSFLLLSPAAEKANFALGRRIHKNFWRANSAAASEDPEQLRQLAARILADTELALRLAPPRLPGS